MSLFIQTFITFLSTTRMQLLLPGKLRFLEGIVFSCVCMLLFFVPNTTHFYKKYSRYLNQTSGIICRPPEQIKFEYHDSKLVLWLEKPRNPFLDLDLDLVRSMPSQSLDGLSGILHGGQPVCKHSWGSP